MTNTAVELLAERVALLDAPLAGRNGWLAASPLADQLAHAARVMEYYTETSHDGVRTGLTISAEDADRQVASSRLLQQIEAHARHGIVAGPLDRGHQQWISTSRGRQAHEAPTTLMRSLLADAAAVDQHPTVTPHRFGLYTSTAVPGVGSMWRHYIEPYAQSILFPRPWRAFDLEVDGDANIAELDSASAWANLLGSYPRDRDGRIYPDWRKVAQAFDGVHIALQCAVATQSLQIETLHGPSAVSFWGVEQSFWLQWRFSEPAECSEF